MVFTIGDNGIGEKCTEGELAKLNLDELSQSYDKMRGVQLV